MNVVLYARVSTDKQADKGLSIPAQLEAMRAYAKQHDWTIHEEFVEPGASAKTADRPVLQRLLARVRAADTSVGVVLVHKIDRLARNVHDHATIKALLATRNIRLASVVENTDDSVSGQLVENIMASIAQFYSANLAEETKKGMRQLVLRGGWPHRAPRGYVMVRRSGAGVRGSQCDVHPREGALVAKGFELFATGLFSIQSVSARLAKDGLVSSTGAPIAHSHLRRILTNPFYVGRVHWQGLEVAGQHKPLVSETLFQKIQALLSDRSRGTGAKGQIAGFPLRAFAICATCRGRFTAERHGRFAYYRCSRQIYRRESCDARFCNADRVHGDIERVLQGLQINRRTSAAILARVDEIIASRSVERSGRQVVLEEEQAALTAKELRLTEAFTSGDLSPEIYRIETGEFRAIRSKLQQGLDGLRIDPGILRSRVAKSLEVATSLFDLYQQFNDIRRAELLRSVFSSIVLNHEGVLGFALRPPFEKIGHIAASPAADTDALVHSLLDAA